MPSHRISIRPGCYGSHAMIAYEHVKELGVQYLELDIPRNPKLLKEMQTEEDLDFKIGSFSFEIKTDDRNVIKNFKRACEVCSQFEYVYFFSSTKTLKDFDKNRENGYGVLRQLGDIANSYGKYISMETHPPYAMNADEMLRTMKSVNHKAIKINFDTANIYHYNQFSPGEGIAEMEKVLQYIGSFHLKQTNGVYRDWYFPALNDPKGIVDFQKIFSIMDAHNFEGIYTLEIEGTGHEQKLTVEQAKKRVADSIYHLKKQKLM